MVDVYPGQPTI